MIATNRQIFPDEVNTPLFDLLPRSRIHSEI